ncbi:DUF3889 domain-containing protein [Metabacillus sediminilitoris]|uniref:DUF3889 domain-containing protein n=1 Tax=Metabacillus sediminilitoris TaxID=2567941 RepID=A0A4S4BZ92_9BACI|nr:DUF3889 domain-containing protein [Metabacillus sediminilitoris]QGQ47238.1 DUF3889 domain-containing protein [Metabacillus sediminilitoris]THF80580.1 DUF3889 domain-containing protein [Metabacillus sediminilitoris]
MKKWVFFLALLYGISTIQVSFSPEVHAVSQKTWEDVAVKETKKRYPLSQILFSQKIWDKAKKDITVKQYRFTLREGMQDFAVYTTITFDSSTGKIKKVQVIPEA